MKKIFPSEMIEDSLHLHYFRHNRKSHLIYISLVLFLLLVLFSLPFVRLEVYSSSRGIVQPLKARQKLVAINSGKILYSGISNYRYVYKGDTLLVIDNRGIDEQLELYGRQFSEASDHLNDISRLLEPVAAGQPRLQTAKYIRLHAEFRLQNDTYRRQAGQADSDFKRFQKLYDRGVLSRAEFEQYRLSAIVAGNSWQQFKRKQANTWQSDYLLVEKSIQELSAKIEQLKKEKEQYLLLAPMNGNLVNVSGVAAGNLIAAGTSVAELTPDMELMADCYIRPMDVGLLNTRLEVSFMIDTYNYNQWGTINGKIVEIAEDIEYMDGLPMFKVRCRLNSDHLQLGNGVRGRIKKGMTFTARFPIAKRTLWQLLYDKTDDWLNPRVIARI
jgi:HlyD family secretion protein